MNEPHTNENPHAFCIGGIRFETLPLRSSIGRLVWAVVYVLGRCLLPKACVLAKEYGTSSLRRPPRFLQTPEPIVCLAGIPPLPGRLWGVRFYMAPMQVKIAPLLDIGGGL